MECLKHSVQAGDLDIDKAKHKSLVKPKWTKYETGSLHLTGRQGPNILYLHWKCGGYTLDENYVRKMMEHPQNQIQKYIKCFHDEHNSV